MKKQLKNTLATLLLLSFTLTAGSARAGELGSMILATLAEGFFSALIAGAKMEDTDQRAEGREKMLKVLNEPREGFRGNLNFVTGVKFIDHAEWKPFGAQVLVGLHYDGMPWGEMPVAVVAELLAGFESVQDRSRIGLSGNPLMLGSVTMELALGVRKYFGDPLKSSFFVGAGPVWILGALEEDMETVDEDGALGGWVGAGYMGLVQTRVNVGGEVRYSNATIRLNGKNLDAGGLSLIFNVGYSW